MDTGDMKPQEEQNRTEARPRPTTMGQAWGQGDLLPSWLEAMGWPGWPWVPAIWKLTRVESTKEYTRSHCCPLHCSNPSSITLTVMSVNHGCFGQFCCCSTPA
jgi:hypothetical protein